MHRRLPAEWEPQDGVLLAWPHAASDWAPYLDQAQATFTEIIRHICRFETAVVVVPEQETATVSRILREAGCNMDQVQLHPLPCNDTWARDFGPLTVYDEGQALLLDFGFNGWGLKFAADQDNQLTRRLQHLGVFANADLEICGMILEGGSIESDGNGIILTTAECLLNANRNPHLDRFEIEEQLKILFGVKHILWLENGYLAGDDTDSHIDTLARLAPDDTIVYVSCDDPADEHFAVLQDMVEELRALRTTAGQKFRLIPLPWPAAQYDEDGQRLPATYANFLVINGAVLMPTYNDSHDDQALQAVAEAFPGRQIIGVDCSALIQQHGSLHCVTMQLPKGVLV